MDTANSERRYAFAHWLRTGRLLTARTPDGVELKFNPWHDPTNGQFTFANGRNVHSGRWQGGGFPGGGGGRTGGGGATGSWEEGPKKAEMNPSGSPDSKHRAAVALTARQGTVPAETRPLRREVRNGYEYWIDDEGRTRRVSGTLTSTDKQVRSRTAQSQAGGFDRRTTDDGGHYIAARFKGPTEAFNHFAQDANFNRGGYRVLEDQWARAKRAGKAVIVKIVPVFGGVSARPSAINVWFSLTANVKASNFRMHRRRSVVASEETEQILEEIGHLLAEDDAYPVDGTLLYARVGRNMVAPSIFENHGNQILYRDPDLDRLGRALLDLWDAQEPENRWAEIEYLIRGERFEVFYIYVDELDPEEDQFDRRDRIVQRYFGDKPIVYPPIADNDGIPQYDL